MDSVIDCTIAENRDQEHTVPKRLFGLWQRQQQQQSCRVAPCSGRRFNVSMCVCVRVLGAMCNATLEYFSFDSGGCYFRLRSAVSVGALRHAIT